MHPDTRARRWLRRALLLLVVGSALVALGHGVGEHAVWPILQAIAGAPDRTRETLSLAVQRSVYASAGMLLAAALGGLLFAGRRRDGSWMFNPATLVIGTAAYAWLLSRVGGDPDFDGWGLLPLFVQVALVSSVYPWAVDRCAAWRSFEAIPGEADGAPAPDLRGTMRSAVRATLMVLIGSGLIALGCGLGEHLAGPAIRALFGPAREEPCITTWSQQAHWLAEVTSATAALAAAGGALLGRTRHDGRLSFNAVSMFLGYWAYFQLVDTEEYSPVVFHWGLLNWLAQIVLVFTLYPWLFARGAAWPSRPAGRHGTATEPTVD